MGLVDVVSQVSDVVSPANAAATGAAAVAGPGAAMGLVGINLVASTFCQGAAERGLEDAERSLREFSKNQDRDDRLDVAKAKLSKGLADVMDLAVDNEDLSESLREDPRKFEKIMEKLQDGSRPEELERIDEVMRAIFTGEDPPSDIDIETDPESVMEKLKEIFDTEDHQEAVTLFMLYEEMLGSFGGQMEKDDGEVDERLDDMRKVRRSLIDEVIKHKIRNQGFDILTPQEFTDREPFPEGDRPIDTWAFVFS